MLTPERAAELRQRGFQVGEFNLRREPLLRRIVRRLRRR
jgi:hypothetical protein